MHIIGHRGARDLAPENTVAGIRFALRRKVDFVEFDVHCTKDNKLIIFHDTFSGFIKRRRLVGSCTYAELKKYAAQSDLAITTFEAIMKTIGDKAKVDIELKNPACAAQVVEEINRQIASGRSYDDFIVSSMLTSALRETQRLNPKIHLAYINEFVSAIWPLKFLSVSRYVKLYGVVFWSYVAPKQAIALAKRRGLWVAIHTVNDRPLAGKFEKMGVDAIITDRPQEFLLLWPLIMRWILAVLLLLLIGYVVWFRLR